ncbi:MAG TPA: hypothetical protein DHV68_06640 [Dehalococcoidia bacterium]|nr:hypothetical protein [Chloroflexota bacterium]HCI86507.1 hypothetical protein [Dehalococcoidia bacterium]
MLHSTKDSHLNGDRSRGRERVTPTISATESGTINKPATVIWDYMVAPETLHEWVTDVNSPGEWIDYGKLDVIGSL